MRPHPAVTKRPNLHTYLWRYFTGHHLDGKVRTNATWFKPGTMPSHHLNWWTAKPRFHRALWRWGVFVFPVGWIIAYEFSPSYEINLTIIITLCALPYAFHHGVYGMINLLPRRTVVIVNDNIPRESVDENLDDIVMPEQIGQDDIQEILDVSVENIVRKGERNATERKGGRS